MTFRISRELDDPDNTQPHIDAYPCDGHWYIDFEDFKTFIKFTEENYPLIVIKSHLRDNVLLIYLTNMVTLSKAVRRKKR